VGLIASLLPRGKAWRALAASSLVLALEDVFSDARAAVMGIILESRPGTATDTLAEWHAALGLRYDPTRPLNEQRARLEAVRLSVGGMTRNQLQRQINLEFPDLVVSEVSANGECGVGECGVSYCNGKEGDYSPTYYDVTGTLLDETQIARLGAILAHFAPAHLIPCLFALEDLSLITGAEAGVAICGVSVAEGYSVFTAPSWTTAATIHGIGVRGTTLRAYPGEFLGGPTPALTYQWNKNASPILGATSYEYMIPLGTTGGDALTCTITASNAAGTAASTSAGIQIAGVAPYFTAPASVSTVGDYLSAQYAGAGDPTPNASYAWYRDGSLIAETGPSFIPTLAGTYYCIISLSSTTGSASSTSNSVACSAPSFTSGPTAWRAYNKLWYARVTYTTSSLPIPDATYAWYLDGAYWGSSESGPVLGLGHTTYCIVTLTNQFGSTAPTQSNTISG
jgi:hypothetical protein